MHLEGFGGGAAEIRNAHLSRATSGVGGSAPLDAASIGVASAFRAAEPPNTVAWVLSYFETDQSLAADSLHLGYSTDGLHWTRLGARGPAYQLSGMGSNHFRDPFILRKLDGSFVLLATDWTLADNDANYWRRPSPKLIVADSKDLKTFSNPRLLVVSHLTGPGGGAMHAWAPEAYYDAARGAYAIVWSGNDGADRNRAYVSFTRDFETLVNPEPQVFFDPGYSIIDSTFTFWNGSTYLFYKDESDNDGGPTTGSGKDIQIARSPSESPAPGSFTRLDPSYVTRTNNQSLRLFTEGAFVVKDPKHELWYLFADLFMQGGVYGAWSTNNLDAKPSSWRRLTTSEFSFPKIVRHANTVRVTQGELEALIAYYAQR
jgi:hypothetical protein